jgi:hypothetical protein
MVSHLIDQFFRNAEMFPVLFYLPSEFFCLPPYFFGLPSHFYGFPTGFHHHHSIFPGAPTGKGCRSKFFLQIFPYRQESRDAASLVE